MGKFLLETCDPGLWWNSANKPENVEIGGTCDEWQNISQELKEQYTADPLCNTKKCEWGQEDVCSSQYWFYDPKDDSKIDMECGAVLIWDPKTETCRRKRSVEGCQ